MFYHEFGLFSLCYGLALGVIIPLGCPLKVHWHNTNLQTPINSVHRPQLFMTMKAENELKPFEPINVNKYSWLI